MLGWTIRYTRNYRVSTQYLEEMAAQGWMLKLYGQSVMFFKKCEPRKLRFAIDYMSKERYQFLENRKSPHVQEYLDLCAESGWDFVDGDGYVYIFCTEDERAVPLQTDAQTYLDSVQWHKKGRLMALVFAAIMFAILYAFPLVKNYSQLLLVEGSSVFYAMVGFVMATLIAEITEFGLILRRERRILEGGQLPDTDPSSQRGQWERWVLPIVWVGVYGGIMFFSGYRRVWGLVILLAYYFFMKIIGAVLHHVAWNHFRGAYYIKEHVLFLTVGILFVTMLWSVGQVPQKEVPATNPGIVQEQNWEPPIVMADLDRESHPDRVTKEVKGSKKAREYYYHEGLGKDYMSYTIYVNDNESAVMMQMVGDEYYQFMEKVRLDALALGLDEAITWAESDGTLRKTIWCRSGNYVMKIYTGFTLTEEQLKTVAELFLEWIEENPYS